MVDPLTSETVYWRESVGPPQYAHSYSQQRRLEYALPPTLPIVNFNACFSLPGLFLIHAAAFCSDSKAPVQIQMLNFEWLLMKSWL